MESGASAGSSIHTSPGWGVGGFWSFSRYLSSHTCPGWEMVGSGASAGIFPFILALGGGREVESGALENAFPSIPVLCGIGWSLKTS